nr:MAG TPA: hypothetical protein [Caudoviricetes sp.]
MVEIPQVGRNVERKSVHGHIARRAHPHGADFPGPRTRRVDPDPRGAGDPASGDAVMRHRVDDGLFERRDIIPQPDPDPLEVEDRVPHDLPRPVERDVPAPVDPVAAGTQPGQPLFAHQQVFRMAALAQRINGRMLDQQQMTRPVARSALVAQQRVEERLLQLPARLIVHRCEIPIFDPFHGSIFSGTLPFRFRSGAVRTSRTSRRPAFRRHKSDLHNTRCRLTGPARKRHAPHAQRAGLSAAYGPHRFVGQVGRAHQRGARAITEAHPKRFPAIPVELLWSDVRRNGIMLQSRPKVLSEGHDPHARFAQVGEGLQHFVIAFAEADHQSAFGHGAPLREQAQRFEARFIGSPRTHQRRKPPDGFDVVPDDVGPGCEYRLQQCGIRIQIGNKELDRCVRILLPHGPHGSCPVSGPAVGQVIARDGGDDDMPELHQAGALGDLAGFRRIGRQGPARTRRTETAVARTDFTQDHESRRAAAPAFGLVGAHSARADRMEAVALHDPLHIRVFGGAVQPYFQPVGFFQYVCPVIQLRHYKFIIFPIDAKIQKKSIPPTIRTKKAIKKAQRPTERRLRTHQPSVSA